MSTRVNHADVELLIVDSGESNGVIGNQVGTYETSIGIQGDPIQERFDLSTSSEKYHHLHEKKHVHSNASLAREKHAKG